MSAHPVEDLLAPGDYWACDEPERPTSEATCFNLRCPRCRIAARAMLAREGDTVGSAWGTSNPAPIVASLADALDEAEERYGCEARP